jgi:hypothetical protein
MAIRPDRPNRYDASLGKSTRSIWTVTPIGNRLFQRNLVSNYDPYGPRPKASCATRVRCFF